MTEDDFNHTIANALKHRCLSVNQIKKVVTEMQGTIYETTAATMAIPLLYAHWEGFVRETLTSYIKFIEAQNIPPLTTNPTIFAFSLRRQLRSLSGKQTVERTTEFARTALNMLSKPIQFSDKTIDTKSNLRFEVLEDLCATLCINVNRLKESKRDINALVNRRNNIAHGDRLQKIYLDDVEEYVVLIFKILNDFETILNESVSRKTFCQPALLRVKY